MRLEPGPAITALLAQWKDGDRSVENRLASLVYPVLHDIARGQVLGRGGGAATLRPTELVSEAYERIADQKSVDWQNRDHFFAIAATVLRRVLIDHIRQRLSEKHGGDVRFVALDHPDSDAIAGPGDIVDWLAVDQALNQLAQQDPATAKVVEMRLFSGLSVEQIAQVCGSSTATVGRQWRFARVWMATQLGTESAASE